MENSTGHHRDRQRSNVSGSRLRDRFLWICPIVGLTAGIVILWIFGFSLWTAAFFALLVACPLIVAWALAIERQQNRTSRKKP